MAKKKGSEDRGQGLGRREVLECMVWAGTGVLWAVSGGVPHSVGIIGNALAAESTGFTFLQMSDSHIGFNKPANPDALGTLREAVAKVKAMPIKPSFIIHTGDITHLSKPAEFDDLPRGQAGVGGDAPQVEQLAWLEADLKDRSNSTPIVVFAHIPLQVIYKEWGWGTEDGTQALNLLKRFGSVTVLNGHIHQLAQKVEGNMTFHTALSTAFPQPAPGSAPSPGPMLVPADKLRTLLGLSTVSVVQGNKPLAIIDKTLAG